MGRVLSPASCSLFTWHYSTTIVVDTGKISWVAWQDSTAYDSSWSRMHCMFTGARTCLGQVIWQGVYCLQLCSHGNYMSLHAITASAPVYPNMPLYMVQEMQTVQQDMGSVCSSPAKQRNDNFSRNLFLFLQNERPHCHWQQLSNTSGFYRPVAREWLILTIELLKGNQMLW